MKIVRIKELEETERQVEFTGGTSFRALIATDRMGFGVCKTVVPKGGPHHWHYPNHLEACYCIKGKGIITDLKTGVSTMIVPDVMYVLDNHDDHTFEAVEDTILISIFNPPLTGHEKHDENGQYK
jgi:L-ectoine synthase